MPNGSCKVYIYSVLRIQLCQLFQVLADQSSQYPAFQTPPLDDKFNAFSQDWDIQVLVAQIPNTATAPGPIFCSKWPIPSVSCIWVNILAPWLSRLSISLCGEFKSFVFCLCICFSVIIKTASWIKFCALFTRIILIFTCFLRFDSFGRERDSAPFKLDLLEEWHILRYTPFLFLIAAKSFRSCQSSSSWSLGIASNDVTTVTALGKRYFVCGSSDWTTYGALISELHVGTVSFWLPHTFLEMRTWLIRFYEIRAEWRSAATNRKKLVNVKTSLRRANCYFSSMYTCIFSPKRFFSCFRLWKPKR